MHLKVISLLGTCRFYRSSSGIRFAYIFTFYLDIIYGALYQHICIHQCNIFNIIFSFQNLFQEAVEFCSISIQVCQVIYNEMSESYILNEAY